MSTDRDSTRIVRSWLRTDEYESADRVLDAVLDQLDTTPQRRATWWPARRLPEMNTFAKFGVAAAVVAVAAILGFNYLIASNVGGPDLEGPTPSPSASPTVSPLPTPVVSGSLPQSGSVIQGSYTIADPFPVQLGLDIGPGWTMWSSGVLADVVAVYKGSPDPPEGLAIGLLIVDNVHADPCDPSAGEMDPPVGSAPMDLAEALAAQTGTESTDPVPVEIDGYGGVFLDYRNTGDGECGSMQRWPGRDALVGERDQVWILDVEGTRLVIDAASFEGTSEEDIAEMRSIVESIQIEP